MKNFKMIILYQKHLSVLIYSLNKLFHWFKFEQRLKTKPKSSKQLLKRIKQIHKCNFSFGPYLILARLTTTQASEKLTQAWARKAPRGHFILSAQLRPKRPWPSIAIGRGRGMPKLVEINLTTLSTHLLLLRSLRPLIITPSKVVDADSCFALQTTKYYIRYESMMHECTYQTREIFC